MIDILTSFVLYLLHRTPERAACVVISLANFGMDRRHVKEMAEYLKAMDEQLAARERWKK